MFTASTRVISSYNTSKTPVSHCRDTKSSHILPWGVQIPNFGDKTKLELQCLNFKYAITMESLGNKRFKLKLPIDADILNYMDDLFESFHSRCCF